MRLAKICIPFLSLLLFPTIRNADSKIPEIPHSEVGFPLPYYSPVSGTFAEIRNHNLHLGSDFKSYGLNGHNILATFDGYVEEISYSKTGYGLSLNLYNPKYKIKSKYAHLHSFGGTLVELELLRRALLLMGDPTGFQLKLPAGMFVTKKGNAIGKTGETGSGPPHLHLEFRSEKGIINPLYFSEIHQKDVTPPTILNMFLEGDDLDKPLMFSAKEIAKGKFELYSESGEKFTSIQLTGKIRIRLSGYDKIRSRNKNNVYGMDLFLNGKSIFTRNFDYLSFEDKSQKHQFYDINRSSLSPPVYFYHMYEQPKQFKEEGYSIDLNPFPKKETIQIQASLRDATGNQSSVQFEIIHETSKKDLSTKQNSKKTGNKYKSNDGAVSIDLTKAEVSGDGSLLISEVSEKEIPFKIPKGLPLKGKIYLLDTKRMSWKGEGLGDLNLGTTASLKDSLYFFDSSIGKFQGIQPKRKPNGFSFKLTKVGYLMVLSDETPPTVFPMTSIARFIELPEVRNHCLEEKYYVLSDVGSGFKTNVELLVDGQTFPYEYDPDRSAIRVQLPKSLQKERPYLLLEVKASDFAGNISDPFVDLISTNGWKEDLLQASCPVIE
ncbi:M23 family metallopeptidase [Leptospira bouyouniensis]|uniref:M23 family metallopeptidase n=1 Tax=Leptospira bouyouniensis TaxID=2484911 RepID=A0A7I0HR83_9LEPT|nr:M23 family metallopeptidase [Leptospira bouyouniensis]TGK52335.1 M23 family metallopeptidase [Leptospira bouyouniensis]TGL04864.1 M23 family metallopeptidase [Leptospira bouyouniensis]TGM74680.1 M23 family metallopeptidase [Leptospira bouyouniensis]